MNHLHGDRDVKWSHVSTQRWSRFWSKSPLFLPHCPVRTTLVCGCFFGTALHLSWRSITVIKLTSCLSFILWSSRLTRRSRRSISGDGRVWGRAVLMPMFEPERVTSSRRGGRGLGRLGHWALWRVFGELGNRHVIQLWLHLRSPEHVHIEDGLPLFGFFVDGQLGVLRDWSTSYYFRPCASTWLGWRVLYSFQSLGSHPWWGALSDHSGECVWSMLNVLPPVADVWMRFWGGVWCGERARVQRAVGEGLVRRRSVGAAVLRVSRILAPFASAA